MQELMNFLGIVSPFRFHSSLHPPSLLSLLSLISKYFQLVMTLSMNILFYVIEETFW